MLQDAIIPLLRAIREERAASLLAEAEGRTGAAENHDRTVDLLEARILATVPTTAEGVAAAADDARAMVETSIDADAADLADVAELNELAGRVRTGASDARDLAFLTFHATGLSGLGDHHPGAVLRLKVAARALARPSFAALPLAA